MISANLQQWIQHPETLNKDTLYELRTIVTRYPYFQSLRTHIVTPTGTMVRAACYGASDLQVAAFERLR